MKKSNFFFLWLLAILTFLATAKSQIRWKDYPGNPVLERGSGWDSHYVDVGAVIKENDSSYIMWYSGSSDGITPRTGRATSKDGIKWEKDSLNPVLQIGSSSDWDKGAAFNPSVLATDSGYIMFYSGAKNLTSIPIHGEIGCATSKDGRLWVKDSLNPILTFCPAPEWDSNYLDLPAVIFEDSTYKMWYNGAVSNFPSATSSIGFATSSDGINWTKYAQNPVLWSGSSSSWDKNGVGLSEVIYDSGYYRMWYEGNITNFHNGYMGGLGYAVSEDGINWKKYPGNPVMPSHFLSWSQGTPHNPSVIRNGNGLRMWYSAFNNVGYATSKLSPPLVIIPDSLSFNGYNVNNTLSLIIGNWGYVPLNPLIIDSLFHLNPNFMILNIPSPSTSIQPFDDIKIQILFKPAMEGSYEDTLFISSNDTTQALKKIVLKGEYSTTNANEKFSSLPLKFNLGQNYPNPFNPSTKIDYAIPQSSFVNLTVYDVLGREVTTLVNENNSAGNYQIVFNTENLPSGIYLYKLQAGNKTKAKKMILLK